MNSVTLRSALLKIRAQTGEKRNTSTCVFLLFAFLLSLPMTGSTQAPVTGNDSIQAFTLDQCIDYALQHQPAAQQALININIAKTSNAISMAGWYPQVNLTGGVSHYLQLPTTFVNSAATGGTIPQKTGIVNTAIPAVSVTQTIFNPSLIYAVKSAPLYIKQAEQINDSTKIDIVANVSKSFYNLLLTLQQIDVLKEDTTRLGKTLHDAYHQYIAGIVDETDYEQATITLNNSLAQLRQANENVRPQYSILKQAIGYDPEKQFNVVFDTLQMMKQVVFDTTLPLQYTKRIEYQALQTTKGLQKQLTNYYQRAYIPTVSAFYNYDYEFQNADFSKLFNQAYPYSNIGIQFTMPIFTGFARVKNVQKAKLIESLSDWTEINLKAQIYSEYTSALANYKSTYYNMNMLKDNRALAKRVYRVVMLQYSQGVVPYLNVITAESNLITAEIGYINSLYQLLSGKIDLEKSMGLLTTANH